MAIPKKPITASPEAIDAFIAGVSGIDTPVASTAVQTAQQASEPAPVQEVAAVQTRKKPVRQKEQVVRQTFCMSESIVNKLEAHCFWARMTKKAVLETALLQYFGDKKIRAIPRQDMESD